MNTPAHMVASLLVWRNRGDGKDVAAVSMGSVIPDLTMFGFYAILKMAGRSESQIFNHDYFLPGWQLTFDLFNSIPIYLFLAILCHYKGWKTLSLFFSSALLHTLCDFPVHNDDAHRHFLPFTSWRFISPLSYWDTDHFGGWVTAFEVLFSIGASAYLVWGNFSKWIKIIAGFNLVLYSLVLAMVVLWLIRNGFQF